MTDAELPDLNGVLDDAINNAIGDRGEILIRWILAAEVIDAGGERVQVVAATPESTLIDALGLLNFALQVQAEKYGAS